MSSTDMDTTLPEYRHVPGQYKITEQMREDFKEDGIVLIRNLFIKEEIQRLNKFIKDKKFTEKYENLHPDGEGGRASLVLWNLPGSDITGLVSRVARMVDTAEAFLGGEVYHYHSKLSFKRARTGGVFSWHQDYGYWYDNGNLYPDMLTCMIALNKADKENGCLKVLRGSHKMGRVTHLDNEGSAEADPERVKQAMKVCPLVYLELDPGDAAFFHCNILHRSEKNNSDRDRNGFLCSYNKASNNPVYKHHHPQYTPIGKVPDSLLMSCDVEADVDWGSKWMAASETKESYPSLLSLNQ